MRFSFANEFAFLKESDLNHVSQLLSRIHNYSTGEEFTFFVETNLGKSTTTIEKLIRKIQKCLVKKKNKNQLSKSKM